MRILVGRTRLETNPNGAPPTQRPSSPLARFDKTFSTNIRLHKNIQVGLENKSLIVSFVPKYIRLNIERGPCEKYGPVMCQFATFPMWKHQTYHYFLE